jgi:hypothetical protein
MMGISMERSGKLQRIFAEAFSRLDRLESEVDNNTLETGATPANANEVHLLQELKMSKEEVEALWDRVKKNADEKEKVAIKLENVGFSVLKEGANLIVRATLHGLSWLKDTGEPGTTQLAQAVRGHDLGMDRTIVRAIPSVDAEQFFDAVGSESSGFPAPDDSYQMDDVDHPETRSGFSDEVDPYTDFFVGEGATVWPVSYAETERNIDLTIGHLHDAWGEAAPSIEVYYAGRKLAKNDLPITTSSALRLRIPKPPSRRYVNIATVELIADEQRLAVRLLSDTDDIEEKSVPKNVL